MGATTTPSTTPPLATVCSAPSTLPRTALSSTLSSARLRLRPSGSTPSTTPPLSTTLLLLSPPSTPLPMLWPPPPSDLPTPPTSVCAPTTLVSRLPAKPCRETPPPSRQLCISVIKHHSNKHHVWVEGHPS